MKYRIYNILLWLILFCFGLVGVMVFFTYSNMTRALKENAELSKLLNAIQAQEDIYLSMRGVEAGYKGFVQTGNPTFQAIIENSTQNISTDSILLMKAQSNVLPAYEKKVQLFTWVKQHIALANELVRDKIQNKDSVSINKKLLVAKSLMNTIHNILQDLDKLQADQLAILNKGSEAISLRAIRLFVALAIVFGLLMVGTFFILGKSLKKSKDSEEEARYLASLVNQTYDAIFSTDKDRIIKSWNKGAESMYGYTKEEAVGKRLAKLIQPAVTPDKMQLTEINLQKQGYHIDEYEVIRKNGDRFPIWVSITAMLDERKTVTGYIIVNKDISERKKLEGQLVLFNEELEWQVKNKTREITEVFERVSDAFVAVDKNWVFTYANERAEQLFHFSKGHFIGKELTVLFPNVIDTNLFKAAKEALETLKMVNVEEFLTGFGIWIEAHIYPSENGLSIYLRNITEKKKAEADLYLANERLKKHIGNTPLAIVEWDANMQIIKWSSKAEEIFGWTNDEMLGKKIDEMDFVYKDDKPHVENIIRQLMRGEISSTQNVNRNYTKKGDIIYCEWYASVLKDEKDEPIALLSLVQDITSRIKAAKAIEEAIERFRLIATTTNDAIWERDLEMNSLWGNEVHQHLYGLSLGDEVPDYESFKELVHPDDREEIVRKSEEAIANPKRNSFFGEFRFLVNKEEYRNIYSRTYIVRNAAGKAIKLMGNMMDITENKVMEEQIRESNRQLRELAGRLQEVREEERLHISREIHDELGQQLSVLKMGISWLSRRLINEPSETREKVEEIYSLLDSTIKTVRRIAADLRPGILDDLGLVAALEWQSRELQARTGLKIEFVTNAPDLELPSAIATALFRIFQESLTNVVKHALAKNIIAELILENNSVALSISDDGQGFDTSKMGSTGTLGLLGMKERIIKLNGEYIINSIQGKGTIVKAIVPL